MWAERLVLPGLMGLSLVTFHTDAPLFFSRNKCLLGNQHWFLDAGWTSAAPVHRSALISEHSQVGSKYSLSFVTVITYSKDISSNKGGYPDKVVGISWWVTVLFIVCGHGRCSLLSITMCFISYIQICVSNHDFLMSDLSIIFFLIRKFPIISKSFHYLQVSALKPFNSSSIDGMMTGHNTQSCIHFKDWPLPLTFKAISWERWQSNFCHFGILHNISPYGTRTLAISLYSLSW